MTDKRIQDKIRKLLALAADPGAAPNEAETAGRQAAALMAKHEIDLADLTEAELKAQWDLTTVEARGCRPGKKDPSEVPLWIGVIAWGVKIYTRTRCSSGRGVVYFRGPRGDVELAQWLHNLLVDGCYRASTGRSISEANAFRNGYAAALQKRLTRLADQRDQVDGEQTGTALVVVQRARARAMAEAFGEDSSGCKTQTRQSQEGYAAGTKAHIPTNRPLAASSARLLS